MIDGTSGQDRKCYTDTQDRESYTVSFRAGGRPVKAVTAPLVLRAGILKRIHVNGAVIRANKAEDTNAPSYTVKCVDGNFYCRGFKGEVTGKQSFGKPLKSGAVVWLETRAPLTIYP